MTTPKNSSTVVLVGSSNEAELSVLLLKRNVALEFVGGAYVFPGGKLDDGDYDKAIYERCAGLNDEAASQLLGIGHDGLAYFVAAARECFEEAGVLLGVRDGNARSSIEENALEVRELRSRLNRHEMSFLEVLERLDVVLLVDELRYFANWITPAGSPRRYDTRFFMARMPSGQQFTADLDETVSSAWVSPSEALGRYDSGEFKLILPTLKTLEILSDFELPDEALQWASNLREIQAVQPKMIMNGEKTEVLLPSDPRYHDAVEISIEDSKEILS